MKRKLVRTGSSLAVTLPAEIVQELDLRKGQEVDLSIHPTTRAITIRAGIKHFDDGRVTRRFQRLVEKLTEERADLYRALAK
jgi:antitoxin component of MazEF toxin-antitoxin module